MSRERIRRNPKRLQLPDPCGDCDVLETSCVETDIDGNIVYQPHYSDPERLFSIPPFKVDGVNIVTVLDSMGPIGDRLLFPQSQLDNFNILEYSVNLIVPVLKYTIIFTFSWRDSTQPQLPNESYDAWVKRVSITYSTSHTEEALCVTSGDRSAFPANKLVSGAIDKSKIQADNEEMIKRYFPSGLLGTIDSIDISISLSTEQHETCEHVKKRCSHNVFYRGDACGERPCYLLSDYNGPNGWGQLVDHVGGVCIMATSGLCASISGIWESDYCCGCLEPCRLFISYSGTDGMGGVVSGDIGDCVNVTSGVCIAISGDWLSASCCPSPSPPYPPDSPSPPTVPGMPTSVFVVEGNASATVTWVAPLTTGGFAITDYVVQYSSNFTMFSYEEQKCCPDWWISSLDPRGTQCRKRQHWGIEDCDVDHRLVTFDPIIPTNWTTVADPVSTATSCVVTGLTNGTSYIIRVKTRTNYGDSEPSFYSAPFIPTASAPSPSPLPSPSPALYTTFNEGSYGTNTYGGTGVHSSLNCVQVGDSMFFDDQYVYQLSMDNAGMVTYEYSIQNVGNFSLFELAGDKLSFKSSSVNITENDIFTITIRASDSANSSSYIDTEVFIPICPG